MITPKRFLSLAHALFICLFFIPGLRGETRGVENGQRYDRLVIRNVVVIDGKGTPARGPVDIVLSGNTIESVARVKSEDAYREEAHVLDGTGMYVLPGLINMHGHLSDNRGGKPIPYEYLHKLYLSCGVTTLRDMGSNYSTASEERRKSEEGSIAAPRIFLYAVARGATNPDEMRQRVREIKEQGGDGVKIYGLDRDIMEACLEESKELGLRVAHHVGVEETDVLDDIAFGATSIEHWYGVPDAALRGSQKFPSWYNYNNENERFRYAGHLWREVDPEKLKKVLQAMIDGGVAWDVTFAVYEANRDLVRAQNQPWFKDYLHPVIEWFWQPMEGHHASYFWDWRTEDEVFWRENYRIWMKAVRDFADMGGTVCVGDDAGSLYLLNGFGIIRELELHQEAGFHPIDIIQHATSNNAKVLGMEDKLGRVRAGFLADLILIDKNPLKNLKYLYPTGVIERENGKLKRVGGVKWTIKDGFIYHAPTMLEDVKKIVSKAKKAT